MEVFLTDGEVKRMSEALRRQIYVNGRAKAATAIMDWQKPTTATASPAHVNADAGPSRPSSPRRATTGRKLIPPSAQPAYRQWHG